MENPISSASDTHNLPLDVWFVGENLKGLHTHGKSTIMGYEPNFLMYTKGDISLDYYCIGARSLKAEDKAVTKLCVEKGFPDYDSYLKSINHGKDTNS